MTDNPLLSRALRVPFDRITPEVVGPGVRGALDAAQAELDALVSDTRAPTFDTTVLRLDALLERVSRAFGIARHLTQVASAPELRTAYNEVLPAYSAFMARIPTHPALWRVIKEYAASDEAAALTGVRRRHLDKTVREFVKAGADLPPQTRERVEALRVELSQLSTRFSENLLDATNAFALTVTEEAELDGLPEGARRRARAEAEARGEPGWRFTLQAPSYAPFMKHVRHRGHRETLYRAFSQRAASGPHDNRPLVRSILARRRELATLLGFRDFADFQLDDRMVRSGAAAQDFERELARRTQPYFRAEVESLQRFARDGLGLDRLEPWDVAFAGEALRRSRFELDDEQLRPFFPLDGVLEGLFGIARRLFGVRVERVEGVPTWHPEVEAYDVYDDAGQHIGALYADWFPRESKRAGAWMNPMVVGGPTADGFDPHVGVIVANVTPPTDGRPALLTHDEVQTLFHEFGHLLHHIASRVSIPARGSMSVAWDFVELPSQLLENWAWQRPALDLFAHHIDTGETLPEHLLERMERSRTFLEASAQMRQLSFGSVDLALHIDYDPELGGDPIAFGQHVMEPFGIRPDFAHTQFLCGFGHIFAGGYAAGYYSYKWSEVLEADAFTRFEREGIFNRDTGRALVDAVLSRGDAEEPEALFRAFMGRDPDVDALIRRNLGPAPTPVAGDD